MEAQNELRVEALRLAIGRNNPVLKQDGTLVTISADDVVKDAAVLLAFLKG